MIPLQTQPRLLIDRGGNHQLRNMNDHPFIPLEWNEKAPASMLKLAEKHYRLMKQRRTTRHFSSKEVDRRLIELAILSGST
ncbi:MAG: hypothetical protein CMA10_05745, partial [Euryarchaeota archaeon]|nr:hypothetical protein [Euryarchaeota archaeon]